MIPPVEVMFHVGGIKNVADAFRTIDEALSKLEKASKKTYSATEKDSAKAAKAVERDSAKSNSAQEKSNAKLASLIEREAIKTALIRAREEAKSTTNLQRETDKRVRLSEQADRAISRSKAQADQANQRLVERASRKVQSDWQSSVSRTSREAQRGGGARADFAGAVYGKSANAVGKVLGAGASLVGGALAVGGGFGIADTLSRESKNQGTASDIVNSGRKNGQSRANSNDVLNAAKATSIKYGLEDPGDVLDGLNEFVGKTGNLQKGLEVMDKLAELSRATGSNFSDMAGAAGILAATDTTLDNGNIVELMRVAAGQGKEGTVEIRDMAAKLAKVASAAGLYGNSQTQKAGESSEDFAKRGRMANVSTLGGLAQMSLAGGASNPAEAMTSAQRFTSDLAGNAGKKLNAMGIETTSGGKLRSPEAVIQDFLAKTGGDVGKMSGVFGQMGVRAVGGAAKVYRDAEDQQKGSGADAVTKEFDRFARAVLTAEQAKEDSSFRVAQSDAQLNSALGELRRTVSTELYPEFVKLVPVLRDFIVQVGPHLKSFTQNMLGLATWIGANPFAAAFAGLGALITGMVAKEMAAAAIGATIKQLLMGSAAVASGSGGAAGLTATGVGAGAITAAPLVAVAAGALMAKSLIDADVRGSEAGSFTAGGALADAENGGASGKARARAAITKARSETSVVSLLSGITNMGFNTAKSLITGGQNDSTQAVEKYSQGAAVLAQKDKIEKAIGDNVIDKPSIASAITSAIVQGALASQGLSGLSAPDAPSRNGPMKSRP